MSITSVSFEEELRKNSELKISDIESLREWCKTQHHLPQVTDSELALFLHSNYFNVEATKTSVDAYYTHKTHVPEIFSNRDPLKSRELRTVFNLTYILPLEKQTAEGYSVLLCKVLDPDPRNYNYTNETKLLNMCLDLLVHTEGTSNGLVIVYDALGASFGHAMRIHLSTLKKYSQYLQEGLPVRLRKVHIIHVNPVVDFMLNMIKPFMKKELFNLIHLHKNIDNFDKFMPLEIFPNEMGGKAGALMDLHRAQIKKLENYQYWFLEEEKHARVDESKRSKKECAPTTSFFGLKTFFGSK